MNRKNRTKGILTIFVVCYFLSVRMDLYAAETEEFTISERTMFWDMNRSWLQGYEPALSYDRLSLIIPIRSASAADNVKAELIMKNEAISPLKPQNMAAGMTWVESGLWAARFSLKCHSDRVNGDYPCTIHVTGTNAEGKELTEEIPYMLRIRDGKPNVEAARIEISGQTSDLKVGEDGTITITLTNPCQSICMENFFLTLCDPAEPGGEILPKESDTIPLPDLIPGESVKIAFPVTVLSTAKVAPHSLRFDFNGIVLGEKVSFSENYTIPVTQEIHLEQGGLRMASSVVAGDSVTASMPLMNMGKADVVNAMVTLSLPGIADRQSVLVGTIAPGETKQAQLTVTAPKDAVGDYSGTLTVQGQDNDGNLASFEMKIDLTVEEAVKTEILETNNLAGQKMPARTYALSGIIAVLGLLLILQGVLLRRKIHVMEEERL